VLSAAFSNISVTSWRSILLIEETGVHIEQNHRPALPLTNALFQTPNKTVIHIPVISCNHDACMLNNCSKLTINTKDLYPINFNGRE
jgi:hypothetical protein